jgi:hypothetical protein
VIVLRSDAAVFTGTCYIGGETTSRALIASFDANFAMREGFAWGVTFSGVAGNWANDGLALGDDLTLYTIGEIDDNSGLPGSTRVSVVHFGNDGSTVLDSDDGSLFGSAYDFGYGIALSPLNLVYVGGLTYSTDFFTTPDVFQPSWEGGTPSGWVACTVLN